MTDEYAQDFAAAHDSQAKVRAKMPRAMKYFSTSDEAPAAPVNTVPPLVTGSPMVNAVLSCDPGEWDGAPTSYAYDWRAGVASVGTGSSIYTVQESDLGDMMSCRVEAISAVGSAIATSNSVGPIVE